MAGFRSPEIWDEAIAFLKEKRDDRPFFMYLAFASPHDPRVAAKRRLGDSLPLTVANPQPAGFTPPTGTALEQMKARWNMR